MFTGSGTAVMRASEEQLKSGVKNKACEVHVLNTFKFIFRLLVEFEKRWVLVYTWDTGKVLF